MFEVIPIAADGHFKTDPIPPGKYNLFLFAVRSSTPPQSTEAADFHGQLQFTVPERGDMPTIEMVAKANNEPATAEQWLSRARDR